ANGAGMAMATMDLIYLEGGKPANFLDIGGGAGAETTKKAFEILSMDKNVKVIFMNIFGGITRCDEVAMGIVKAFKELNPSVPIILRLSGTNEEEGRRIIEKELSGRVEIVGTMEEGARRAVEVAKWQ
ncbi:MAG: succinate--CoA ligase subunit beta, partial [Archaeoglobaceae archaeon]